MAHAFSEAIDSSLLRFAVFWSIGIVLVAWYFRNRKSVKAAAMPGVREYPIVGALDFVLANRFNILSALYEVSRRHGHATFTAKWLTQPRYYITSDPACVEHILRTRFDAYPKGPEFLGFFHDLLGSGIFNSDGERWRVQRKMASHMFSAREFNQTIMVAFAQHAAQLDAILANAAETGKELNMAQLFFSFTLDSICKIAFGIELRALEALSSGHTIPFAAAFDSAQTIVGARPLTPMWQLLKFFRIDAAERQLAKDIAVMDAFAQSVIDERRAAGPSDFESRHDVLSRFMSLKDDDGKYTMLHDDQALKDTLMNFMIAGRDTTAQALSWCVWLVSQHPEVEARLREEITTTMQQPQPQHSDTSSASASASSAALEAPVHHPGSYHWCPSYDTLLNGMRYTKATVMETLRLYPSVPKDLKQYTGDKNDVWPDGTVVEPQSMVIYFPYAMGRKASLWGEDCEQFRPERMLTDTRPSPYKFIAFNAGPRTCLGQNMALVEASYVLSVIYSKYTLELVPGQTITHVDSLTLPQREGVRMRVHRRA
jgi:fatty acid omega-hydroxylase